MKLAVRRKPYSGPKLARGRQLQYRRNKGNGSWLQKASDGHGKYWTKAFAQADDFDESNGETILTFYQAQDVAKKLASSHRDTDTSAPITVDRALIDYKADLLSRGAGAYNAQHPRVHLTSVLLSKPVALLASKEMKAWRDGLLGTIAPATINRVLQVALRSARAGGDARSPHPESRRLGNRSRRTAERATGAQRRA